MSGGGARQASRPARPDAADVAKAWPRVPLGDCCRVVNGTTPSSGDETHWNGDVVWVTPTDLGKLDGMYVRGSARTISRGALDSHNLTLCPPGSVVLSSRAPIGHLAIAAIPLCTNQGCKTLVPLDGLRSDYLYYALVRAVPDLKALGSGATFAEVSKAQVEDFRIPLPPLAEQERIAGVLTEQLGAVERARAAAAQRLAAAEALPAALLREVFDGPQASEWEGRTLGELLNRYNEIIHPGDRKSGEAVFVGLEHIEPHTGRRIGAGKVEFASMTGRKPTFKRGHIVYGYLRPYLNKVWVADFDGCSSVDQFAFAVNPDLADTTFVAAFMRSATFLRRAQGVTTTGQLPRISIDEIAAVKIDLPPDLPTQRRLAAELGEKLATAEGVIARCGEELAAIEALPASLLREAFSGRIAAAHDEAGGDASQAASARVATPGNFFRRGAIASYIVNRLHALSTFGRVHFEKNLYLTEAFVGVDLAGRYKREAAGPLDADFLYKLESLAAKHDWFTKHKRGAEGFFYRPGGAISDRLTAAEEILAEKRAAMDRLLDLTAKLDTERLEIVATLFAAWNDRMLDGANVSDGLVIEDVRQRWNVSKQRFTQDRLSKALGWMREQGLTPRGIGPRTIGS